jgi:hypothetical protein
MDPDEHLGDALALVEERISYCIRRYSTGRNFFRRSREFQVYVLAVLGATTTLFVAFNQIYHRPIFAIVSLVTAALTTVVTTVTSGSESQRLWLANTATLVELWALRDQVRYDKALHGVPLPRTLIDDYHGRLQKILADHNQAWHEIHSPHKSESSSQAQDRT